MITAKMKKRPLLNATVTKPYQGKGYAEGFDDGKKQGYTEGETAATERAEAANAVILTDCNAVLPTKGVQTAETLEQVPQRIGEITVTEDLLRYCNKPNFPGLGVFDKEDVVLDFDYAYSAGRVIYVDWGSKAYPNIKVKHLTVNFAQKLLNTQQMFAYTVSFDDILERITINADFSQSTSVLQLFSNFRALKVIDGTPLDLSSSTNNTNIINYCESVEEIRFAPNTIKVSIGLQGSSKLSNDTVQSIVDALKDLSGATAQTLTLHATVGAKLTEAQKATITAKNWTLVY